MEILLALYICISLVLALVSLPLIARKIKPNPIYGFRVPKTLNNPRLWYDANSYAGKWFLVVALVFLIAAVGLYRVPGISIDEYALACLGIFVLVFGLSFVQCLLYLNRLE